MDAICIWVFDDAPEAFRLLSTNGGDEDWLAHVPVRYKDAYLPFLNVPHFGSCDVDQFALDDGSVVYIGSHA